MSQVSDPKETTTTTGVLIHGATAKTTPADADEFPLADSAATFVLKKVTWANIKATLAVVFESLANKATDFSTINDTKYPSVEAVAEYAVPTTPTSTALALSPDDTFWVKQNDVVLAGAGDATVDGTYIYRGQNLGYPYYNLDGEDADPYVSSCVADNNTHGDPEDTIYVFVYNASERVYKSTNSIADYPGGFFEALGDLGAIEGSDSPAPTLSVLPVVKNGAAERSTIFQFYIAGINANAANTDAVLMFPDFFIALLEGCTGYLLNRVVFYGASVSLTTAQFDVRTASGGSGTALVDDFAPTVLSSPTKFVDATLAAPAEDTIQTVTSLFFRNTVAQGSAAAVKAFVELVLVQ